MSGNTAVYAGAGLLASEAFGVTDLTPIGRSGDDDSESGGGLPGINLPEISLPNIDMGAGPQLDFSGLGEGLGELARQVQENSELPEIDVPEMPGMPGSDWPGVPGPDDLQNATDSAGESVGSSVGTALGTAMYELVKTPSLALAEDLEPILPYAEGDGGDTLQAMWDDSATRALADAAEGPLPYAEGDWQDTKQSFNDDVTAATDAVNDAVNSAKETASGGVTGDSDTNVASETTKKVQDKIDAGLTGDDDTNLASETGKQMQKDVGTAIEEGFKIDNPMTGKSIDDTLNSAGLETNYSWDGPTVSDATDAAGNAVKGITDRMEAIPL